MKRIILLLVVSAILVAAVSAPAGAATLGERFCNYALSKEGLAERPIINATCAPA